jgi:hypothetical protein
MALDPDFFNEFAVRGRLGAGGMGIVYRVSDPASGRELALKVLRDRGPEALYQLKREFRALEGIVHPNLVELYDLVVEPDQCFLTMELLEGVDFVSYVRGPARADADATLTRERLARLRGALPQLFEGLAALHAAGKLHRDVKPQNVLVTHGGRVVLLDFGLATERAPLLSLDDPSALVGTVGYMPPEQAMGDAIDAASDLFSVGVMLFEALSGRLPFDPHTRLTDLMFGGRQPPPSPDALGPDAPGDLAALAVELLRPDPRERPDALEALRRLGRRSSAVASPRPSSVFSWGAPFVGREAESHTLRDALAVARAGAVSVVHVVGASGIGKSALVRNFFDEVALDEGALALQSRCHLQESVPFKALDNLVDMLSLTLASSPLRCVAAWTDRDACALAEVFPVLRRAPAIGERWARARALGAAEPHEMRRRAFAALEDLLREVASSRLLALWIDDLQWCDLDSLPLLQRLTQRSDAPPMLVVLTYRSEDREASRALVELDPTLAAPDVWRRTLALGPLPAQAARELVRHALRAGATGDDDMVDALAAESEGVPFLAAELARFWALRSDEGPAAKAAATTRIDAMVLDRVRRLTPAARALVEVVAVANGPIAWELAASASGVGPAARLTVGALRADGLLRHVDARAGRALDTYHDRIRESVRDGLDDAARARCHGRLAGALEARADADPLQLYEHWRGAGDLPRAARYAAAAARAASQAFAFDQAARLFAAALALGVDPAVRSDLLAGRGAALSALGCASEAAQCYAAAAEARGTLVSDGPEALRFTCLAAERYLQSGHVREGTIALTRALGAVGATLPRTPASALAAVLWHRARMSLRGMEPAPEAPIAPATRDRLDALWAGCSGLIWVDPIRSGALHAQHVREALASGDRGRALRAYASEATVLAAIGGASGLRKAQGLLARAEALAASLQTPEGEGLTRMCNAGVSYFSGRFRESVARCGEAERVLRERCTGVAWELTNVHLFGAWARLFAGAVRDLGAVVPAVLEEADARDDLLAYVGLATSMPSALRWFAADAPRAARDEVSAAIARWPATGVQSPHLQSLGVQAYADLYDGDGVAGWSRLADAWPGIERTLHLRFQSIRALMTQLRACAAATAAASLGRGGTVRAGGARWDARALLAFVERSARWLEREGGPWCAGWGAALSASVSAQRGDDAAAVRSLREAEGRFEAADMPLLVSATRLHLARLVGGDEGGAVRARAVEALAGEGVRAVEPFARMFLPIEAAAR